MRVTIPERVCPHCGGTEWYINYSTKKGIRYPFYICVVKRAERDKSERRQAYFKSRGSYKVWGKRYAERITDGYIRRVIKTGAKNVGATVDVSQLTQEDYKIYREGIKVKRINGELIKNGGQTMKTSLTVEEKNARKREYMRNYWKVKQAEKKALNDASLNHLANESVVGGINVYSDEQCRLLLSAHNEGKSHSEISRMYAKEWNRTPGAIALKIRTLLNGEYKKKTEHKPVILSFEDTLKQMLEEKTHQVEKLNKEVEAIKVLLNQ